MDHPERVRGTGHQQTPDALRRGIMERHTDPRLHRPARGLLVVPFLLVTGVSLVVLTGLERSNETPWVLTALFVGGTAAAVSLAWSLVPRPGRRVAAEEPPPEGEATGGDDEDPLSNVQTVESQARRQRRPCPNCGTAVSARTERCPNCDHHLLVECKGCRTKVRLEWSTCPECGRSLP